MSLPIYLPDSTALNVGLSNAVNSARIIYWENAARELQTRIDEIVESVKQGGKVTLLSSKGMTMNLFLEKGE